MKKILLASFLILACVPCHAAETAKVEVRGSISDGSATVQDSGIITKLFTSEGRESRLIRLTANAFTNITVPTSADAVLIDVGSVRSLTLRAVTGSTGISLDSACPVLFPISADNVTFGLYNANGSDKEVRVYFL